MAKFIKILFPPPMVYVWILFAGVLFSCHLYRQREQANAEQKTS